MPHHPHRSQQLQPPKWPPCTRTHKPMRRRTRTRILLRRMCRMRRRTRIRTLLRRTCRMPRRTRTQTLLRRTCRMRRRTCTQTLLRRIECRPPLTILYPRCFITRRLRHTRPRPSSATARRPTRCTPPVEATFRRTPLYRGRARLVANRRPPRLSSTICDESPRSTRPRALPQSSPQLSLQPSHSRACLHSASTALEFAISCPQVRARPRAPMAR